MQWTPTVDSRLAEWWTDLQIAGNDRKELATAVNLICWMIWKHRDGIVFDNKSPNINELRAAITEEWRNWTTAKLFSSSSSFMYTSNRLPGQMWRDAE